MTIVQHSPKTTQSGGIAGAGFMPGQSGNPGRRPKGLSRRVRELVCGSVFRKWPLTEASAYSTARIANSPKASKHGGEKSGSGGSSKQGGTHRSEEGSGTQGRGSGGRRGNLSVDPRKTLFPPGFYRCAGRPSGAAPDLTYSVSIARERTNYKGRLVTAETPRVQAATWPPNPAGRLALLRSLAVWRRHRLCSIHGTPPGHCVRPEEVISSRLQPRARR